MRNTIIIGSALALIGFASVAQASDWYRTSDQGGARADREFSDDARGKRHERYEQRRGRRHHEGRERHRESREMHREFHERREHR